MVSKELFTSSCALIDAFSRFGNASLTKPFEFRIPISLNPWKEVPVGIVSVVVKSVESVLVLKIVSQGLQYIIVTLWDSIKTQRERIDSISKECLFGLGKRMVPRRGAFGQLVLELSSISDSSDSDISSSSPCESLSSVSEFSSSLKETSFSHISLGISWVNPIPHFRKSYVCLVCTVFPMCLWNSLHAFK